MATAMSRDEVVQTTKEIIADPELKFLVSTATHVTTTARSVQIDGLIKGRVVNPFADPEVNSQRLLLMMLIGEYVLGVTEKNRIEMFMSTHRVATALLVYVACGKVENWADCIEPGIFDKAQGEGETLQQVLQTIIDHLSEEMSGT